MEAKFLFVEHQASSGEMVPLIKDWKDVLNKVGTIALVVDRWGFFSYLPIPIIADCDIGADYRQKPIICRLYRPIYCR